MKFTLTLKDILFLIAVIVLCLFLFRCTKACERNPGHINSDTLSHKIDTVFYYTVTDTVYVPKIIAVNNTVYKTKWIHDTLQSFEVRIDPADTAAILKRYYQKAVYSDTQKLNYGTVIINDTVTQNRIVARGLKTNIAVPTIKETTVLRTPERTQIWIGANAMTDLGKVYTGAELMMKTKGNIAYSGGVMIGQDGKPLYTGGVKVLIRLRKPR
jgi:hypothetical protein